MGWAKKNVPGYSAVSKTVIDPISKPVEKAATTILQPIEKAVVQPVSRGLASFDKMVGNTIPGGWGTLGTVAASMIPGGQFAALGIGKTAAMTGLGALTGSGVLRPGRSFNLQGALMGGAMAYGMSNLADYAAAAGGAPTVDTSGALTAPPTPGVPLVSEPPLGIMDSISKYAGDVGRSITAPPSTLVQEPGLADSIMNSFSNAGRDIASFADKAVTPSTYTDFGSSYAQNVSDIGSGIKNLLTTEGAGKAAAAATGINPVGAAGATLFGATGLMALDEQEKLLKEQLANQQIAQAEYDQALGEINRQRDYAAKMVRENPFRLDDTSNLRPDRTVYERARPEQNLYERSQGNLYAYGGSVDDELGGDYSAMGMDQGNLQKGLFGLGYKEGGQAKKPVSYKSMEMRNELGMPTGVSMGELEGRLPIEDAYLIARLRAMRGIPNEGIVEQGIGANIPIGDSRINAMVNQDRMMNKRYEIGGSTPFLGGELSGMMSKTEGRDPMFNVGYRKRFATGGTPRFLSGGGDGMSDSIPASIEGKQEARLADGEFVVSSDVVSGLGNGSSKAGAKQLYAMMDRVRQARTKTKKQAPTVNPRKLLPA